MHHLDFSRENKKVIVMLLDRFGGQHTDCQPNALVAYETAVEAFLAHKPAAEHLNAALCLDPDLPAAHALLGLGASLSGRAQATQDARVALDAAQAALRRRGGGTPHERALACALSSACSGQFKRAGEGLNAYLIVHPTDALSIKLSHALLFMAGQVRQMLQTTATVLPAWTPSMPGYGFILGCRAFSLEENGSFKEAEKLGRRAVEHEPEDVWGLHAVAHVMEMTARTRHGRIWLEAARAHWGGCGPFAKHLLWHLALFYLSDGDAAGALDLYDAGIRPVRDGDFRDVANAVSLLWRLQQNGVDVGARWEELHQIASERRRDCTYAFATLHYLMAMLAAGDRVGAEDCLQHMRRSALARGNEQASVLARIGIPLGETLLAARPRSTHTRQLAKLAHDLADLGGSRAQQDVFLRSLIATAISDGDAAAVSALLRMRQMQRAEDDFQVTMTSRAASRRLISIPAEAACLQTAS